MTTGGPEGKIDPTLRDRVNHHVELFRDALEEATADPSPANKQKLSEAADRLMRAVSGVMVEASKI
jgi:hypothetical protein